jgi:hypothetical protein
MRSRWIWAPLLGLALPACSATADLPTEPLVGERPSENYALTVDRSRYRVRYSRPVFGLVINVTFTNRTSDDAWIPSCRSPNPPVLEKRENGQWVEAFVPVVLSCLGEPEVIAPGEHFRMRYEVVSGYPGSNVHPQFSVRQITGVYRLRWDIFAAYDPDDPGLGTLLPLDERVSPPFGIVGR